MTFGTVDHVHHERFRSPNVPDRSPFLTVCMNVTLKDHATVSDRQTIIKCFKKLRIVLTKFYLPGF